MSKNGTAVIVAAIRIIYRTLAILKVSAVSRCAACLHQFTRQEKAAGEANEGEQHYGEYYQVEVLGFGLVLGECLEVPFLEIGVFFALCGVLKVY